MYKYTLFFMIFLQMIFLTEAFARGAPGIRGGDLGDQGRIGEENRNFQGENRWNQGNDENQWNQGYYGNMGGYFAPPPSIDSSDQGTEEIFEQNENVPND